MGRFFYACLGGTTSRVGSRDALGALPLQPAAVAQTISCLSAPILKEASQWGAFFMPASLRRPGWLSVKDYR